LGGRNRALGQKKRKGESPAQAAQQRHCSLPGNFLN
jgi:hypothetical protein